MFKTFARKIQLIQTSRGDSRLKDRLIAGAIGSFGLKIAGAGMAFIMSILFARFLGTAGLGIYSYATTWANLISIPATLGLDQLIVREMAIYRAKSRWGMMAGILHWSSLMVLGSSLLMSAIAIGVVWLRQDNSDSTLVISIVLAMVTIPIASLRNLRMGAMRGLNQVVLGQVPESLFSPIIIIALTGVAYLTLPQNNGVYWVLAIKIVATIATFVIGAVWLWRSLPLEVRQATPQYEGKQWVATALPFMFLGTVGLINSRIDIVMLGNIQGVKAVGIYAVVVGITKLTAFVHQASLSVLAPNIATLYSEGKTRQLERLIQKSILVVFVISLLIGGTIIGCGRYLLLIFGAEFVLGSTAMNILVAGQVFDALTGPVGLLLTMTGYQNQTAIAAGASAVLNVILNLLLIPQWGINGAAVATTISLVVINIIKLIYMQKKLNISVFFWNYKSE